jgi:hypothetical protein
MSDREHLEALYTFMTDREFILGTEPGVRDMVKRYQHPPMTLLYRVSMRMTVNDYDALSAIMKAIETHLNPVEETTDAAV